MNNRFEELDGLKIIFALLIFLHHYFSINGIGCTNLANVPSLPKDVFQHSFLGVEFFFMISGFFIHLKYQDKIKALSLKEFLFCRLNKILPLYLITEFLAIIFITVDHFMTNGQVIPNYITAFTLLNSLLMVYTGWIFNLGHPFAQVTWFVNVLFLCYLLYYIVLKYIPRDKVKIVFIFLIIIGFVCCNKNFDFPFLYTHTGRGLISFFIGALLLGIYNSLKSCFVLCLLFVVDIILLVYSFIYGFEVILGYPLAVFNLFICPILILSTLKLPSINRILKNKYLVKFSKIATALYFSHYLVLSIIAMINIHYEIHIQFNSYLVLLATSFIVVLISILWHFTIEKITLVSIKNSIAKIVKFYHDLDPSKS